MSMKEEEVVLAAARALNGEDIPTSKKRGQPSKGRKASAPPKKKKCSTKKATKGVVDLDGGSSLEGEESAPTKWRDYEVETLIAIWGEIKEEFTTFAKKTRSVVVVFVFFFFFFWLIINQSFIFYSLFI
jgi:hypothetical protein